jgi:hypothetical protein
VAAGLIPATRPGLRIGLVVAAALALAACGIGASRGTPVTFPPESFGPSGGVSSAVEQARGELIRALGAAGYQVGDPRIPYRTAESARLAGAPRRVVQVLLPDEPEHGFISIYEFPDPATARVAGEEEAVYLASGPGRVQFQPDTRLTLRQLGTTLVFYAWSPANAVDQERSAGIQRVLETIGTAVAIPR